MKNLFFKSTTLLVLFALLFTACEEDTPIVTGDPLDTPPSISFIEADDFLNKDTEIEVGQAFAVRVEMLAGTSNLSALTIYEDGVQLDPARISIAGVDLANNPQLIINKTGQTFDITIAADPAVEEERFYSYAFEVEDEGKLTDVISLGITTLLPEEEEEEDVTTPLEQILVGVLLNQAGPSGTGGLDLDTGTGTGSNDASAEIQDEGIDFDKTADVNWRQQISGANGSIVRLANLGGVAENLTFDKVENKEQVLAAYEAGASLAGNDMLENPSDNTNDELVSDPVQIGDVFAVFGATTGKYYLLQCTNVNATASDNDDSYEFTIKF